MRPPNLFQLGMVMGNQVRNAPPRLSWTCGWRPGALALRRRLKLLEKAVGRYVDHLMSRLFWAMSAVVGTALVLLNQGDRLVAGEWAWDLAWKLLATYLLSFLLVAYLFAGKRK